jgi:hypothetical protein
MWFVWIGRSSAALRELLTLPVDAPSDEVLPMIQAYVNAIPRSPARVLTMLDQFRSQASAVFGHMERLFERMFTEQIQAPQRRSSEALAVVVLPYLNRNSWWAYASFRPRMLDFCLREAIAPRELVQAVLGRREFAISRSKHLAQEIAADRPLDTAYRACALKTFWPAAK